MMSAARSIWKQRDVGHFGVFCTMRLARHSKGMLMLQVHASGGVDLEALVLSEN